MKIKITLNGQGGELDSRILDNRDAVGPQYGIDPFENGAVNAAIKDLAKKCVFSVGDTITIEEVD